MKRCVILTFIIVSVLTAWDYKDKYEIASPQQLGIRNDGDGFDSLRTLPPRMRGFGNEEYFQTFIRPQTRDSLNVRCVGRWPFGPGFEVYGNASTNILAFGAGSGILVFDISTPSNPVRLSQIAVNGLIMQVYLKDTLLFVASYGNGIEIFNLANPSVPVKISQITVPARDFCLKDTFAYCVAEDSLRIINFADIFNPYQVGACWDSSYTVSISGNYVYTGGRWKLSAIDIINPANPTVVNFLPLWVYTLTCDGNHLYCVLNSGGFTIYNISNPLSIWQESQLNTVGGVDIYKLGFYVYLPGFVIVDVADSANPFVVGDTSLPVYTQAVWVNNNFGYGYIANDYVGLTQININNPTNPIASASIYGADDSRDVFVQGNYAYVSNWRKGLKILDVSTPSSPFEAGEYDTAGIYPHLEALWVRDSIAYLSVEWPLWFKTININDPSNPLLVGQCRNVELAADMVVRDSFAYSVGGRIFQIIKIINPAFPDTFPRYYLPNFTSANGLFIQDTFAYIADGDSGLRILNISNPAAPFEGGHFDNPPGGYATGIFIRDTLVYFASGSTGLRVLNITNPSSPFEIGFHPNAAIDVIVKDTMAYVTSYSGRVNFLSISNPANLVLCGYYDAASYVYRLFIDSIYVFVSCYEEGINILEWHETGIAENNKGEKVWRGISFKLAPTVTSECLNLTIYANSQNCTLMIYDASGRKAVDVFTEKSIGGFFKKQIDIHSLSSGIYFVVLKSKNKELVKKFIVIR